jgi:hypothetical protein
VVFATAIGCEGIRHTVTPDPIPSKSSAAQILFLIFLLIQRREQRYVAESLCRRTP